MSTFEDITARMVEELGPLDIPEEPELLVTIFPGVGDRLQFTVSCGKDRFLAYMMDVLHTAQFVDFTDIDGVAHIIATSTIAKVDIEEEEDGDSPAAE